MNRAAPVCRRLGCNNPATSRLVPQYGRDFPVCDTHGPSWLETFVYFDNRQSRGSQLVPL